MANTSMYGMSRKPTDFFSCCIQRLEDLVKDDGSPDSQSILSSVDFNSIEIVQVDVYGILDTPKLK